MAIVRPKQLANQQVSALHVDSTVAALVVHSVDASGAYVSPGAGSTQVSIKEILTSSGASVMDSTNNAIGVTIRAGSAAGTEYQDGDTDATPNGGVIFFNNSSNTMRAVSALTPLPVSGSFSASTTVNVSSLAGAVIMRSSAADALITVYQSTASALQATVTPVAGSTWNVRPLQSSAADLQATVTPAAGSTWAVRPLQSSAADLQATVTPAAGSTWAVRPLQSSAADLQATVTPVSGSTWNTRNFCSSKADFLNTVYQSTASELQATVTPVAGSTWNVRPLQSSAADLQATVTPAAGSTWSVRPLQSSAADLQATVTPAAGSTWAVRPLQSSQGDLRCTIYQSSATELKAQSWTFDSTGGGILGSTAAHVVGANGLAVRQVFPTLLSTTVLITSSHSTALYSLISSAAGLRHKVYGYFISSTHTVPSTLVFMSSNAIDRWHVGFGSGSSGMTGANMAMTPPAWLFHADVANALNVRIEGGSSITSTVIARISICYFTEA